MFIYIFWLGSLQEVNHISNFLLRFVSNMTLIRYWVNSFDTLVNSNLIWEHRRTKRTKKNPFIIMLSTIPFEVGQTSIFWTCRGKVIGLGNRHLITQRLKFKGSYEEKKAKKRSTTLSIRKTSRFLELRTI